MKLIKLPLISLDEILQLTYKQIYYVKVVHASPRFTVSHSAYFGFHYRFFSLTNEKIESNSPVVYN